MTQKALDLLENEDGFFLQIESALTDKREHEADICGAIGEVQYLNGALEAALDFQEEHPSTLIVVTSDHGHATEIVNGNGAGRLTATLQTADNSPMYIAFSNQTSGAWHGGETVPVMAKGPGAFRIRGTIDQTELHHMLAGDSTPPTVEATVDCPAHEDVCANHASLELNATDEGGSGVSHVEYSTNAGTTWQRYSAPIAFGIGSHPVAYRATDKFDNVSETQTVEIDVVQVADANPPTVTATVNGNEESEGRYYGPVTLTLDADDDDSGVEAIEYRVHSGDWVTYENPVAFEPTGFFAVEFRARDVSGNISEIGSVSFGLLPPCAGSLRSDEFTGTTLDSSKWSFRHTRNGGTPAGATVLEDGFLKMPTSDWQLDGTTLQSSRGPVNFIAQPLWPLGDAWQAETQFSVALNGGYQHYGIAVWQSDNPVNNGPDNNFFRAGIQHNLDTSTRTIHLIQSKDDPTGGTDNEGVRTQSSLSTVVSNSAVNPVLFRMRMTKTAGNDVVVAEYRYSLDAGVTWNSPNWTAFPSLTGGLTMNTSPRRDSVGTSYIGIMAGGNYPGRAGNWEFQGVAPVGEVDYFRVTPDEPVGCEDADVDPPVSAHALSPALPDGDNDWYTSTPEITLTSSDGDGSGLDRIEWRDAADEGGPWEEYDSPIAVDSQGETAILYRGVDEDGNTEPARTVAYKLDSVAPVTTAVQEPSGAGPHPGPVAIDLSATDATSGVATTRYVLGAGALTPYGPGPVTVTDPGAHSVGYESVDEAGNVENRNTLAFNISDPTPPKLAVNLKPKKANLAAKKKSLKLTVKVRRTGGALASTAKVCIKAPKKFLKVKGAKCKRSKALAPGASGNVKFTLKTTKKLRGKKATVTVKTTGAGAKAVTKKLKVKQRK